MILSGANGDITVTFTSTTPITKTSTAALADITTGECVVATGTKDSTGQFTARMVRLAPSTANGCTAGGQGFSPPPAASPRPSLSGQAGTSTLAGEVTAVSGTSVTLKTPSSGSQSISVPTVASITASSVTTAAALQVGECLRAAGRPDASGTVAASSL